MEFGVKYSQRKDGILLSKVGHITDHSILVDPLARFPMRAHNEVTRRLLLEILLMIMHIVVSTCHDRGAPLGITNVVVLGEDLENHLAFVITYKNLNHNPFLSLQVQCFCEAP